jgi:hypothetical protein
MKFSYYLYLIIAMAAGLQFYINRSLHKSGNLANSAQIEKVGFEERKKYLNLKDPE